jgi:hypothetical protein
MEAAKTKPTSRSERRLGLKERKIKYKMETKRQELRRNGCGELMKDTIYEETQ